MRPKSTAVIIVAAGKGERASADGNAEPKQYRPVAGKPILSRTIAAFLADDSITHVLPVIHADHADRYAALGLADTRLLPPAQGGITRQASVLEGLKPKPHFSRLGALEQQLRLWTDASLAIANERLLNAVSDTRRRPQLADAVLRRTTLALCMMAATH